MKLRVLYSLAVCTSMHDVEILGALMSTIKDTGWVQSIPIIHGSYVLKFATHTKLTDTDHDS